MKNLIIKLRKTAGLSQEDLSKKLRISRPTLIAIEKGERDVTLAELKALSKIFDIPIEIIMNEEMSTSAKLEALKTSEKDYKRFQNLVLECIKYGSDEDGLITKTKLAKLVYLCDFANYYHYLKPISGLEYQKLALGPVAIEFFDMIDTDESVSVEKKDRALMISLAEQPDDSVFDAKELNLIKEVCKKWKKAKTNEIVEFTHRQIPWKVCKDRDVIPYSLINNEAPENVY